MTEQIETLIIGGGQAGLAASYWFTQYQREHVVLEQAAHPAHVWRDDRWDSFALLTPNWTVRLPGADYAGPDPEGFMPRADIVAYFETYITRFNTPLRCNVRVESVEPNGAGYRVQTTGGEFAARNVIVATGLFQKPKLPPFAGALPVGVAQLPSGHYRHPPALPPGAVLVVGSAQSGCQIAEELYLSGRTVYLSTSSAPRVPRRYRGKDAFAWLVEMGAMDRTVDKLPSPRAKFAANPQVSGKDGGRTLNLHQFARDGVKLLGRLTGVDGPAITLAPDLHDNLARADKAAGEFCRNVDAYIEKSGLSAPAETVPELRDGFQTELITGLDVQAAGIRTVIWALGYSFDFSLVRLPVTDGDGFPVTQRGVTRFPGLYFLGMPWLYTQKSGLLLGVGEDARFLAEHLAQRPGA